MRPFPVTIPSVRLAQQRTLSASLACALWLMLTATATAAPFDDLLNSLQPTANVNDFAGILNPEERLALEERCQQLQAKTGTQLSVVTIKSLAGGEVDDFTNKLFARWGVGQA